MKNGILKYSIDDLVRMLKIAIADEDIYSFSHKYSVSENCLKEILARPKVMTFEMYMTLEKVLNKSIDELTTIIEFTDSKRFRADKLTQESDKDVELAENIFKEIISVYKLRGL